MRSEVTPAEWEVCKRFVKDRSGNRCEICGGKGRKWPVECHEIWGYEEACERPNCTACWFDGKRNVQRLIGLIALCPMCHAVKHIGRTQAVGALEGAVRHIMRVNQWSYPDAEAYLEAVFEQWARRSEQLWELDISYLTEVLGP